jgi:hypothetical protein
VVIVPIWKKGDEKGVVMEAVASVQNTLKEAGIRVKVDDSELRTPGWKFNFYEMKVMTSLLVKLYFSYFFYFYHVEILRSICSHYGNVILSSLLTSVLHVHQSLLEFKKEEKQGTCQLIYFLIEESTVLPPTHITLRKYECI